MGQELQDKIKVIAAYDGIWKHIENGIMFGDDLMFAKDTEFRSGKNLQHKYLTSLDWLHPVAMKVSDELWTIITEKGDVGSHIYYRYKDLLSKCANKSENGNYTHLFNAVYDAIVFINQNK